MRSKPHSKIGASRILSLSITKVLPNRSVLTVSVTAKGKTATEQFTHEEILDSGEAVDASVSVKVRMLVSHFI